MLIRRLRLLLLSKSTIAFVGMSRVGVVGLDVALTVVVGRSRGRSVRIVVLLRRLILL